MQDEQIIQSIIQVPYWDL